MVRDFEVQQLLFGYDAGHNLIAFSIDLSSATRRMLNVLTDLSGPQPASGFDFSITGLSLPETPYYALFATWLAPEMARPGCVWSHALLIPTDQLGRLSTLSELRKLFSRPIQNDFAKYRTAIHVAIDDDIKPTAAEALCKCEVLMRGLYENPDKPVVVFSSSSLEFEDASFLVWSQQWPGLREQFRFSTGSFSDRGRTGVQFDLQVSPVQSRRAWPSTYFQAPDSSPSKSVSNEPWLREALVDLRTSSGSLREFLWKFGQDCPANRASFASLCKISSLVEASADWPQVLLTVAEAFPAPAQAVPLKEWLLRSALERDESGKRAWLTIQALMAESYGASFGLASGGLALLISKIWRLRNHDLLELLSGLIRSPEGPLTSQLVGSVAENLDPRMFRTIWDKHPELIPILVSYSPRLSWAPEIWQLPLRAQWRVHDILESLELSEQDWTGIIGSMLQAETDVGVRKVCRSREACATAAILRWIGPNGERLPPQAWRDGLSSKAIDALHAQDLPASDLALYIWIAPVDAVRKLSPDRQDLRAVATTHFASLPPALRLPAAFLCLSLALRNTGDLAHFLMKESLFAVHEALGIRDGYPAEAWDILAPDLPYLGRWSDWDRCEKVRRAARDWLRHNKGALHDLRLMAKGPAEKRVLKEIAQQRDHPGTERDFID